MATKAWERRDDEGAKAFDAFTRYLGLPAGDRSLAAVGQSLGKSTPLMERWSARYGWVERVRAWDNDLERKRLAEEQRLALKRMRNTRARHRKLGQTMIQKLAQLVAKEGYFDSVAPAQLYQLVRAAMLLEQSGATPADPVRVAVSGDLADPLGDGSQAAQQGTTMLRKLEIEIVGAGGQLVPAGDIAREMVAWYDKPEPKPDEPAK